MNNDDKNTQIQNGFKKKMDEIKDKVKLYLEKYKHVLALPEDERQQYWSEHKEEKLQLDKELGKCISILGLIDEWLKKETEKKQEDLDLMKYKIDELEKYGL